MAEDRWYSKRSDLYHVDPRTIVIVEGWNPRTTGFDLEDILPSIRENGVLVPLRLKKNKDGQLELRDGERRYRAVMQLIADGCEILTVPCILEKSTADHDLLINALLANTGKRLDSMDEANAFRRFIAWGWSVEQLAQRLGKHPQTVRSSLTLLDAAPVVVEALQDGTITKTDAVAVVRKARKSDTDQATLLDAQQTAKQGRKARKTRTEAPRSDEDDTGHWDAQVHHLCDVMTPEDVLGALVSYLDTRQPDADYLEHLRVAQTWIQAKRDIVKA